MKTYIENIWRNIETDGKYSIYHLPKHVSPSVSTINDWFSTFSTWWDYGNTKGSFPELGPKNKIEFEWIDFMYKAYPFINWEWNIKKNKSLPSWSSMKPIRKMGDPYHCPKIGGKDGVLTKLIRSMPIGDGTCYYNAMIIALSIPGVKICRGFFPATHAGHIRKTTKGITSPTLLSNHKTLHRWMEQKIYEDTKEWTHAKDGWYVQRKGDSNRYYLDYIDTSKLEHWTGHAWCSFEGYHFDPYLYSLNKRYGVSGNYVSAKQQKIISWVEYRLMKETDPEELNLSELQRKQVLHRTIQVSSAIISRLIQRKTLQAQMDVMNPRGLLFPAKIPSNRRWMKDLKPFPVV